jgi:hypothetical protein
MSAFSPAFSWPFVIGACHANSGQRHGRRLILKLDQTQIGVLLREFGLVTDD